jgi:SP family myo-inositol transporter-like MFS transporter 13
LDLDDEAGGLTADHLTCSSFNWSLHPIACNFTGNLVISLTFLTLTQRITATGTFWLYAGILIIAWFFVFFLVPETAGMNLEDIQELFRKESLTISGPSEMYVQSPASDPDFPEEDSRRRRRGRGSFDL